MRGISVSVFKVQPNRGSRRLKLDLAIRNVKGEITRDEVSQRLKEHYGNTEYVEPKFELDGGYEIIPPNSPRIKEIEEYNRKLRPVLYAELDKKIKREELCRENPLKN